MSPAQLIEEIKKRTAGMPFRPLPVARLLSKKINPEITQGFRSGDVRHCSANISLIKNMLSWSPKWDFTKGMEDLIKWGEKQNAKDLFNQASRELTSKGLLKS